MSDLKQASARGVAWNLAQNLVGRLLGLVVVAILGRILEQAAFGALAIGLAVTSFAEILTTQGYNEFIAQRPELTDDHLDTAFWLNAAIGVVLTVVIIACADLFASWLDAPGVGPILRWLALSVLIRSLSVVPTGLMVRQLRFRALSLRSLTSGLIAGAAGVTAALSGLGLWALVVQVLVGEVVSAATLWIAVDWRPGRRFSMVSLRDLAQFGVPVLGAAMLWFASRRLDAVIVGTLGLTILGSYTMGQRVFHIANQVLNKSGDTVALSALSRLIGDPDARREAFYKFVEMTAVLYFPIYAALALLAEPFVLVVFGDKWISSAAVLTVFAISGVPVSLSYLHASALKSAGRTRSFLLVHVVMASIYLPLLLIVLDRGVIAAAGAYLVSAVVILPVEILLVREAIGIHPGRYLRRLITPLLATLLMSGVTYAALHYTGDLLPIAQLAIGGAVGVVAYVVALRAIAPTMLHRVIDLVRTTVRKKTGKAAPAPSEPAL